MIFSLTKRLKPTRLAVFTAAATVLASCVGPAPPAEAPGVTAPVYVGEIEKVNSASTSVLIDVSSDSASLQPGTELTAISPAGEATRLKVTEGKRPNVAANVVSGSPKRGQRVYR